MGFWGGAICLAWPMEEAGVFTGNLLENSYLAMLMIPKLLTLSVMMHMTVKTLIFEFKDIFRKICHYIDKKLQFSSLKTH